MKNPGNETAEKKCIIKKSSGEKKRKMNYAEEIKKLENSLISEDLKITYGKKMSECTTFKIGGAAEAFAEAQTPESLLRVVRAALNNKIPYFMLGGGSNLLVNDSGIPGFVIKNRIKSILCIKPEDAEFLRAAGFDTNASGSVYLTVGSGVKISELTDYACENGLSGFEFMSGIPGTLGGAVFGNAGAYGKSASDFLAGATLIDAGGNFKNVGNGYFDFSYRASKLKKTREIVTSIMVKFEKADKNAVKERVEKIIAERHTKHPSEEIGSAGSYFKNIPPMDPKHRRIAAGYFLEQAGVKGLKEGHAEVYVKHANFIINPGGASSQDVLKLARLMKVRVLEQFGLLLEEEVQYVA